MLSGKAGTREAPLHRGAAFAVLFDFVKGAIMAAGDNYELLVR
jgi:hypothetical protein